MTAEEQSQFDSVEVEIKNLEKTIELVDKVPAREAENKTIVTEPIYAESKDHKPLWKNFDDFLGAV
jgi:hypothetical protein